jgi:CubicO group peptidase (beta-lactamase class C family)
MAGFPMRLVLLLLLALSGAGSLANAQEELGDDDNELSVGPGPNAKDLEYAGGMVPPETYRCVKHGTCRFADFLPRICALVVVQDGTVRFHYFNQTRGSECTAENPSIDKRFGVASIAKSITATLLGLAGADGNYGPIDLESKLSAFQPGLAKKPGRIKLEHALRMRGGLKGDDNGEPEHAEFYEHTIGKLRDQTFLEGINNYADTNWWATPGVTFRYSNMTSAIIGTALESVLQKGPAGGPRTLDQALKQWIWDPVGMAGTAGWKADKANSPSPYCCLKMRAYDLAKFGAYILEQWNTPQAKLHDWLRESTDFDGLLETDACFPDGDTFRLGYGYQWWVFADQAFGFTGIGTKGQFLHIIPQDRLVIVQFSTIKQEYDDFQCDSWSAHAAIRDALRGN